MTGSTTPELIPGTVTEHRQVRAHVMNGPAIEHPANADQSIRLTMVDVLMRRYARTATMPHVHPDPMLASVTVHGTDQFGRTLSGTWPYEVIFGRKSPVPAFIREFAKNAVAEWAAEIQRRGTVVNQVSGAVTGTSIQAGGSIVVGGIPFER